MLLESAGLVQRIHDIDSCLSVWGDCYIKRTGVPIRGTNFYTTHAEVVRGLGTEVTKISGRGRGRKGKENFPFSPPPPPPVPLFALVPCVRATSSWLSLSTAKRKRKRLLRRLGVGICCELPGSRTHQDDLTGGGGGMF